MREPREDRSPGPVRERAERAVELLAIGKHVLTNIGRNNIAVNSATMLNDSPIVVSAMVAASRKGTTGRHG